MDSNGYTSPEHGIIIIGPAANELSLAARCD